MKKHTRKTNYKENGITLIALVVTIIVLLILAGVTLNLVMGENGIINRSQYASNTWSNATKDEEAMMRQAESDTDELTENYIKNGGKINIPTIKDKDGETINIANISSYYGKDVEYNGKTFQLFYYDSNGDYGEPGTIWLQYKGYVSNVKLYDHLEKTGILTDDANSKIWDLNPNLKNYQTQIRELGESNLKESIKGIAYLCNTANWNEAYVDHDDISAGAYAIGAASIEMFCDSYTQATGITLKAKAYNENNTFGYRFNPGYNPDSEGYGYVQTTNYLSKEYGGMYNPGSDKCLWFASPASQFEGAVCTLEGKRGGLLYNYNTPNSNDLRPVVCLPSSIEIRLVS